MNEAVIGNIPFEKYLVFKCIHCGRLQGKQNYKYLSDMTEFQKSEVIGLMALKCISCRKTVQLKDRKKGGVRTELYWFMSPQAATKFIQEKTSSFKNT